MKGKVDRRSKQEDTVTGFTDLGRRKKQKTQPRPPLPLLFHSKTAIQPVIDQARPVEDLVEKVKPHSQRLLAAVDPHFAAATRAADGHLSALRPWQVAAASAALAAVLSGAAGAAVRRLTVVAALFAAAWAAAERHGLVEKVAQA